MNLKTLNYSATGRPQIVNADFVPTDLVEANVPILNSAKMQSYLHAHAMRAVCDLRGRIVARFKPNVHPYFGGDDDFEPEAA
jgi:hypothetical protein